MVPKTLTTDSIKLLSVPFCARYFGDRQTFLNLICYPIKSHCLWRAQANWFFRKINFSSQFDQTPLVRQVDVDSVSKEPVISILRTKLSVRWHSLNGLATALFVLSYPLTLVAQTPIAFANGNCPECNIEWAKSATPELLTAMFDAGASPNGVNPAGSRLAFLIAMYNPDPDTLETFFIEADQRKTSMTTEIELLGSYADTLIHAAARNAQSNMVRWVLAQGFDPNVRDSSDRTPLHAAAAYSDNAESIAVLIKAGADPNAVDGLGWTPLHNAAMSATNLNVIRQLLDLGADPSFKSGMGLSASDVAMRQGRRDAFDLLSTLGGTNP